MAALINVPQKWMMLWETIAATILVLYVGPALFSIPFISGLLGIFGPRFGEFLTSFLTLWLSLWVLRKWILR